jgi:hypothetical protein
MGRSTFMTISAILALVFGLGFILVPAWTMSNYGIALGVSGQWMARYLGSAFIGIAVLTWLARDAEPSEGLSAVMLGAFVVSITGLVVAVFDALAGLGNALHWLNVVIYLFLTVGWGYFQFVASD